MDEHTVKCCECGKDIVLDALYWTLADVEAYRDVVLCAKCDERLAKEEEVYYADDDTQRHELAAEAFASGGMGAYNEAMGHGVVTTPEPCGHHCDDTCPRCGDGW